MLMRPEDQQPEFSTAALKSIKKTVSEWKGDEQVRSRVLNSIGFLNRKSVAAFLHDLVKREAIERRHWEAWDKVRNNVMHGNLVTPWSSQEEDENIIALAELVHSLTREIAGVSRISKHPGERQE
jgi:hypothetical protein